MTMPGREAGDDDVAQPVRGWDNAGPPRALWLVAPLVWLPMQFAVASASRPVHARVFGGEGGVTEILTAALLLPAAWFAGRTARRLFGARAGQAALFALFAFGCVFLAAEEVSYGQHVFAWGTPDYFEAKNMQAETNLHNLEYVDKSLTKWVVMAGIVVGGIGLPLVCRGGVPGWMARFGALVPRWLEAGYGLPTAAMALGAHLAVKVVAKAMGFEWEDATGVRLSEVVELYITWFFLLYAWGAWVSVRGRPAPTAPGAPAVQRAPKV